MNFTQKNAYHSNSDKLKAELPQYASQEGYDTPPHSTKSATLFYKLDLILFFPHSEARNVRRRLFAGNILFLRTTKGVTAIPNIGMRILKI